MDVRNVIKELVKNSIDAKCTVVEIELDDHSNSQSIRSFDVRVTDDGFGFNEQILHEVGERQVFSSSSANEEFRYGNKGKSLLTIAQITEEMYIESIERNSNVRFYKSINIHKPEISVYRTSRELKDATYVTGIHGTAVVLNNLYLQDVIDAVLLKKDIIKGVIELALINYNIKISIKDTATQNVLYETDGMDTQFEKFEQFLESNQVYSRLRFVSCQKDLVKVELFLCENGIPSKNLQFVYFNKSIESDGKWRKVINDLCEKQFKNDLNAKFAVYLADIRVKHLDNILVDNVIVNNCIKKCIEQMSQASSKFNAAESKKKRKTSSQYVLNEGNHGSERQINCNERKIHGVRLGDWIFNNSCEYEIFDEDRNNYRNKVCENWVIALDKPKPKDPNDSLQSVEIEKKQRDDDKFKKPLGRPIRKSKHCIKVAMPDPSQQITPKPFEPSNYIDKFNSSSLMRETRKLIADGGKNLQKKLNMVPSETSFRPPQPRWPNESSLDNVHQGSSRTVTSTHMPTAPFCHTPPNNNNLNKTAAFNSPNPNIDISLNDRFQIHRSVKETFNFQFHNNQHNKSNLKNFENNRSSACTPCRPPPQSQNHASHYQSAVRESSQIHYHHRRRRSSSLSTFHQSEMSSRVTKNRRSTSRSSSNCLTTVAPRSNNNTSNGIRNHGIRHGRHRVTININFG